MKRCYFSIAFALLAWTLLGAVPALAVLVSVDPPSQVFTCEDTADVYVTVDGVADLRGFSLALMFDSAILTPVAVEAGPLLSACPYFLDWLSEGSPGDSLYVDGAGLGCSMVGPGAILRIRFTGQMDGISPLSWTGIILRDSQNATLPTISNGATLEVENCPVHIDDASWGRIKDLYADNPGGRAGP